MKKPNITQAQLKEVLDYDPETGIFTWIVCECTRRDMTGQPAGNITPAGYIRIGIRRKLYLAHRLAWLYMTGEIPKGFLDHRNRVRNDNRWDNLRRASPSENAVNRPASNPSGLKGAYKTKGDRWVSSITIDRKSVSLGRFNTAIEAHEAYMAAAKTAFGEFATNG